MKLNNAGIWPAAAALLFAPAVVCAAPPDEAASRDIRDYVPPGLQDLSLTLSTGRYDPKAGDRIGKEFGQTFQLSGNGSLHYKQPSEIRLDGKLHGMNGTLIMNGFSRRVSVGWLHKSQDESFAPGKVVSLLDVGLLNAFYLSYATVQFRGTQAIDGTPCTVFRLSYPARLRDASFRLLWIDPHTRTIRRREEHSQDGTLHAVYSFRRPVLVSGVWLSPEVDAANAQGEFVGQTFVQNARMNTGLTDTLFH